MSRRGFEDDHFATTQRVSAPASTKDQLRIAQAAEERHAAHPEAIPERLRALEREWDTARALRSGAVAALLLQHAIQGAHGTERLAAARADGGGS